MCRKSGVFFCVIKQFVFCVINNCISISYGYYLVFLPLAGYEKAPHFCGIIMENKAITVHTEGLNRYGYRVLTSGLNTKGFEKNPVMFFGHATYGLPIGTWSDLQKHKDGRMTAVPVFDEVTELSKVCKALYDAGTLRAASIHFRALAFSDAPKDLLPGQKNATVTESDMLEISMVGVPGNSDATLSAFSEGVIPILSQSKNSMDHQTIAAALGLSADAGETEVLAAIKLLKDENKALAASRTDALIAAGKEKGVVTDGNEAHFRTLAASNYEALKGIVDAAPKPDPAASGAVSPPPTQKSLSGMLSAGAVAPAGTDPRAAWTFDEWSKKDPKGLLSMKTQNPQQYQTLVAARQSV